MISTQDPRCCCLMTNYDPYEKDLKEFILDNPDILDDDLGYLGKTSVIFEKKLTYSRQKEAKRTIADAIVFTEHRGIVGIEIKTSSKKDSTVRLKRQLKGYSLNSNYVYVFCHDTQIKDVERILKSEPKFFDHVGIVAYDTFKDSIIPGTYKQASRNPHFSAFHALNMLRKVDVRWILTDRGIATENLTKRQLINVLLRSVGEFEAIKYLCNYFTNNKRGILKLKHFRRKGE